MTIKVYNEQGKRVNSLADLAARLRYGPRPRPQGGFVAATEERSDEVPAVLSYGDDNMTKSPRERAARALCRKDGHPENITFEGKPMWMSYLDVVDIVLAELEAPQPAAHRSGKPSKPAE